MSLAAAAGDIPLVDNHCHRVVAPLGPLDVPTWRAHFTESTDPGLLAEGCATTLFYQRMIRDLAEFFGVEDNENAVLAARNDRSDEQLLSELFGDASFAALVVDNGYPKPPFHDVDALTRAASAPCVELLRIEPLFERIIAASTSLDEVIDQIRTEFSDVRGSGFCGLKSVVAYRTGLRVQEWSGAEAMASFADVRRSIGPGGALRLAHKPLLDTLLHEVFRHAHEQRLPVQFHTGYGDADVDLILGDPVQLRSLLQPGSYRGMQVVLLHGCYPFTRKGAYLASIYDNVWLDLSYAVPFLSVAELRAVTRHAFGLAPTSKLLYSSDGVGIPELHWSSARYGRKLIGEALDDAVLDGDLSPSQAKVALGRVLRDNANALYEIGLV